ncbi:hypothetical protein [Luteolibacter sp. Populi]|uniref:hypothetical protein n=1 Tax=Luteolibacter sp. Populi TaxID=3230487 RepID=UPI00346690BC
MAFKLPDHSAAGPIEKRWFTGMTVFSVAAALIFYGRVAFVFWGKEELVKRKLAAGSSERMVGSDREFLAQIELGIQVGWLLLMVCCMGFLICGGIWLRMMRRRQRTGRKR